MDGTGTKLNKLSTKKEVIQYLLALLDPLDSHFSADEAGFYLGDTCAHYPADVARMEGLSRALWGIFPLMLSGEDEGKSAHYIAAIKRGTDPTSCQYWGKAGAYDQRLVEMAVYGLGLALLQEKLTDQFSAKELGNLFDWLNQISSSVMPDSNWNYFAIMVQLGFKRAGLPWDKKVIEQRFDLMEAYYLGGGWYADGAGRPRDYYISMAFQFYGLIYATLNGEDDPERAQVLRDRAVLFAQDFVYMSAPDGASIPFGRSLTYRFATVAFWSAVAFSGLQVLTPGQVKGIILRNLRWWQSKPFTDRDGIMTLGYAYPNLAFCEDYNSPGSPYWALKTFLIVAIPEDDIFWRSPEEVLPKLHVQHAIPQAAQLVVHPQSTDHVYLLTSGQLELNNYVNTESKYTKFAYSSLFGFTFERGRFGIKHAACDSMLLLSEGDDYWRGRRDCEAVRVEPAYIWSRWSPWADVHVESWLVACDEWHLRIHRIDSVRRLNTVEGGFALRHNHLRTDATDQPQRILYADNGTSAICDLSPFYTRTSGYVVTPPNSSIMFAECAAIPTLSGVISPGVHWHICAVAASGEQNKVFTPVPKLLMYENKMVIRYLEQDKNISISI